MLTGPRDIRSINRYVEAMRRAAAERDKNIDQVRSVRRGDIDKLWPDFFADDLPKAVVGNLIDVAARDTAELMAPLPALACVSGNMHTAAEEIRASRKNKIGSYYWRTSKLDIANVDFADSYNSYGFGVYLIEPDYDHQCPRIKWESPFGAYYGRDRWGRTTSYAKIRRTRAGALADEYPEYAQRIMHDKDGRRRSDDDQLRLIRYMDKTETIVYLPESQYLILGRAPNCLSRLPVVVSERPSLGELPRGQYDDSIWPTLARARMMGYHLKSADQAVNAPWRVPDDVTEVHVGPDAILRSQNPQLIGRVNLDIPRDVFTLEEVLDKEIKLGSRYPEARTGGVQGNIVTGRGVEALMGTMDTQVQMAQTIFARALEEVTSLCFEMDVALWGNAKKTITGVLTGKPFEINYTPRKDIGDNTNCKVTYGFAAGQTPAQAIVALLQLRGDSLVSRDTVRRQLPFDLDPEEEQRSLDQEQLEDSLKQGLAAALQSIGPMVMQGQNPLPLLAGAASAIEAREKGVPLYKAIKEALGDQLDEGKEEDSEPGAQGAPGGQPPGQGAPGAGGQLPPGVDATGLPAGVAPGQQGMPPGGLPAIQQLIAGFRGGNFNRPELVSEVKRRRPVGMG